MCQIELIDIKTVQTNDLCKTELLEIEQFYNLYVCNGWCLIELLVIYQFFKTFNGVQK